MALNTLTLLLAATGAAVALYRLGQRSALDSGSPAQRSEPGADEFSPLTAATPNPAERLQDLKLVNTGMGSTADDGTHEDLLAPPRGEAQQSDAIKPGLPDLLRGA